MGDKTGIQWTNATWNPIRGCSRVSEGCRNCYAETVANRFKGPGQPYEGLVAPGGQWNGNIKLVESVLDQPLRWQKPRLIFVNSMSDLFHENVPFTLVDDVFAVMASAHWHTFQILTKRPERMLEYLTAREKTKRIRHASRNINKCNPHDAVLPLPNVWLGVSVEDQATADERVPLLLQTPASVRWISAEPLLGPVLLQGLLAGESMELDDYRQFLVNEGTKEYPYRDNTGCINWVVVGGESGTNARPIHPSWAQSLRDQCQEFNVPFFFKQWGEWAPRSGALCGGGTDFGKLDPERKKWPKVIRLGEHGRNTRSLENCDDDAGEEIYMQRVGKKLAGRMLDGVEWNQYPETATLMMEERAQ